MIDTRVDEPSVAAHLRVKERGNALEKFVRTSPTFITQSRVTPDAARDGIMS